MNVTINAFFSGTGHKISDTRTLAGLLHSYSQTSADQAKIGFDGCGVTHGIRGMLFGSGLDEQCQEVIQKIKSEIKKGNTVTLNVYGHSRGAIAALLLAKQLSKVNPELLNINLALLDPVPGNFITTSTLDQFEISLAKKTMDLRACRPLKRVLALYPHEPLSTLQVHAPLLSLYPEHTEVEEDVIAGCHAGAQFQGEGEDVDINDEKRESKKYISFYNHASYISFARVYKFLQDCGTSLKSLPELRSGRFKTEENPDIEQINKTLVDVYQAEKNRNNEAINRDCHSATGVHIKTKAQADYFNLDHQKLTGAAEDKNNALVTIEKNIGPISQIKRAILSYPKAAQLIKWTLISFSLATVLFFTGGIGAIAGFAGISLTIGALSILPTAPIAGGLLAAVWYGALRPFSQWAINRFFYPHYHMRNIHVAEEKRQNVGSTDVLTSRLGMSSQQSQEPETQPEPQQSKPLDFFAQGKPDDYAEVEKYDLLIGASA